MAHIAIVAMHSEYDRTSTMNEHAITSFQIWYMWNSF